jgi:hypothetical protein
MASLTKMPANSPLRQNNPSHERGKEPEMHASLSNGLTAPGRTISGSPFKYYGPRGQVTRESRPLQDCVTGSVQLTPEKKRGWGGRFVRIPFGELNETIAVRSHTSSLLKSYMYFQDFRKSVACSVF